MEEARELQHVSLLSTTVMRIAVDTDNNRDASLGGFRQFHKLHRVFFLDPTNRRPFITKAKHIDGL